MDIHNMPVDINDNKFWSIQKENSTQIILLASLLTERSEARVSHSFRPHHTHFKRKVKCVFSNCGHVYHICVLCIRLCILRREGREKEKAARQRGSSCSSLITAEQGKWASLTSKHHENEELLLALRGSYMLMLTRGRRPVVGDINMPTTGESSENAHAPTQRQKQTYIHSPEETGWCCLHRNTFVHKNAQ